MIELIMATVLSLSPSGFNREQDFQDRFCQGAIEYMLPDRTRVDCLTDTHAIEYDYARKWAESIGQSLHYASMTGKRAGIVLIVESDLDLKKLERVKRIIKEYDLPVDVFTIVIDRATQKVRKSWGKI